MSYYGELAAKWRPLLGAVIGIGSGMGLSQFTTSILAPGFVKEFGWDHAQFAALGGLSIFTVIFLPIIGRLTDILGVKKTALIGVITLPLTFLTLSQMTGDMRIYTVVFLIQASICLTTTLTVYSRVVVQHIVNARGLALGIVASGAAIVGFIGTGYFNNFVETQGWRAGYVALAIYCAVAGVIALLLIPSETRNVDPATKPAKRSIRVDYPIIFRSRAFWILVIAMLLVNSAQVLALQQMKFVLLDNGITATQAGSMLSLLPLGMLVGRFGSGYLLDRMSAKIVATVGMALPSVGLFLMGSSMDSYAVLMTAVLLIGLSYGAEGDVVAFLVARNFGVGIYGSVYGLLTMATSTSASLGTLTYSYMLAETGSYTPFLYGSAVAVLIGALSFLFLPTKSELVDHPGAGEAKVAPA